MLTSKINILYKYLYLNIPCVLCVEKGSLEYTAFIQFYDKLTTVFYDKRYLAHFVCAEIILPNDVHYMSNLSDSDRAMNLLSYISTPLEYDEKQNFYKMLEMMQSHGNNHAQQLAEIITAFVRGVDPPVSGNGGEAPVALNHAASNYY